MSETTDTPLLTKRFDRALTRASQLHRTQLRKSTDVPYVSHLMSVAALVIEDGGDEEEAIAALLHDALEDRPEEISAADIEREFGPRVRELVEGCTDTAPGFSGDEKGPWRPRKEDYIDRIVSGDVPTRLSLADKLHNARCILRDHRAEGESVWDRFSASKDDTLWYYRALERAYREAGATGYLVEEFGRVVRKIERMAVGAMTG